MNRLKQLACCYSKTCDKGLIYFRVKSDSIEILQNPQTFYSKLQKLISQSKKRVILSSLYIGTGELEENLINSLHSRLEETKDLRVSILVDYNRGQRLKQKNDLDSSSKGLLRSLAHKANIYFFLSPAFGSYFKRYFILPIQSVNESLSTQHIKCYIGDDDVILSGANLTSEEVNGFYRADGPKKLIPSIYTQKSRDFLSSVQKSTANVNFQLYHRKNWTFHAKGFWTHLDDGSYITTIGSSNYACRSVERDLEMQFLVATVDKNLIDKLENERAQLWRFGAPIKDQNELPQVPLTARMLSKTLGNFF
ncbi:CDP-diacylglycerol--glycerol-3-phosphate 3-phosphatidyltransferase, mitochondrial isoform X2 [Tetranychus urticae]|uniref:CDP-diacylglycerol--glycerol-3-phosphate 3-phosphatidyltransferase, mitochondrial isoform X2 n=1 Tax=Tetranychus urticae TaxID=32264 RepID=UPI00077BD334|nr:CDP-diacylglycerol--glycerol-3-phosphate 3-phosphatidyltransferase, mitochondrial isoform X2 [Tetranychus urticae]